jgi:hypothetical protein
MLSHESIKVDVKSSMINNNNNRKLNQLIKKNRYSLSLIDETFAHLSKTKYFIKLDIRQTFHRIKIADAESENLIIFRTRFDVYKYRVLLFELCNESITYQHYMNDVFFDYLNDFVSIYINDILIYNNFKKKACKARQKDLAAFTRRISASRHR